MGSGFACCQAHGTHSQPWGGHRPERSWPTALPMKLLGLGGRSGTPNELPPESSGAFQILGLKPPL